MKIPRCRLAYLFVQILHDDSVVALDYVPVLGRMRAHFDSCARLYAGFLRALSAGAKMNVQLVNEGPVTLVVDSPLGPALQTMRPEA